MQYTAIALSLFAATAAAQNSTSLPDLVSQIPQCALTCFGSAAEDANCAETDFSCLCGDGRTKFINSIGPCIVLSAACTPQEQDDVSSLATEICSAVASNPDPSAVASASDIVTSAVGTASPSSTPGAAARPELGMGAVGIAAMAALAL